MHRPLSATNNPLSPLRLGTGLASLLNLHSSWIICGDKHHYSIPLLNEHPASSLPGAWEALLLVTLLESVGSRMAVCWTSYPQSLLQPIRHTQTPAVPPRSQRILCSVQQLKPECSKPTFVGWSQGTKVLFTNMRINVNQGVNRSPKRILYEWNTCIAMSMLFLVSSHWMKKRNILNNIYGFKCGLRNVTQGVKQQSEAPHIYVKVTSQQMLVIMSAPQRKTCQGGLSYFGFSLNGNYKACIIQIH